LIQTVLQAMSLYIMTNITVPLSVLDENEAICRRFLWAKSNSKQGIYLVLWEDVCQE